MDQMIGKIDVVVFSVAVLVMAVGVVWLIATMAKARDARIRDEERKRRQAERFAELRKRRKAMAAAKRERRSAAESRRARADTLAQLRYNGILEAVNELLRTVQRIEARTHGIDRIELRTLSVESTRASSRATSGQRERKASQPPQDGADDTMVSMTGSSH